MTAPSLAEIVGANLRRVRESRQLTRSDTVRLIWERTGQAWSISEIDILENAKRVSVTVNDLVTLACAFDLPALAFLDGNGAVQIGDGFRAPLESLMGDAAPRRLGDSGSTPDTLAPWLTETDESVATRLGITRDQAVETARELWGHTATQERDRRLGDTSAVPPRSLQGKRGAMTRALTAEIRAALAD